MRQYVIHIAGEHHKQMRLMAATVIVDAHGALSLFGPDNDGDMPHIAEFPAGVWLYRYAADALAE